MSAKTNLTSDAFAQASRKPTADDILQARLRAQLSVTTPQESTSQSSASVALPTVRAMQKSLEDLQEAGMRVDTIEALLANGVNAVELDPNVITLSPFNDRFDGGEADEELCSSIITHGQIVPILVRPYEAQMDMYQIVYGRRRLSAAKKLGIKVKAFIKSMSDDQAITIQAIENAQREDLTFIERAVFAYNLDSMRFPRESIGSILKISKSKLSEMISIPNDLGIEIIRVIGAAKEAGYRPWQKLARLVISKEDKSRLLEMTTTEYFKAATPDERLSAAISLFNGNGERETSLILPLGTQDVTIRRTATQTAITINRRKFPGFANFVEQKLPELFTAYQALPIPKE